MSSLFKNLSFNTLCLTVIFFPIAIPLLLFLRQNQPELYYLHSDGVARTYPEH